MRTHILCLFILVTNIQGFSQKIENDVFDDLKFESRDKQYTASLKQNIFNDLIFSDSRDNKITLENKYLHLEHQGVFENSEEKINLFRNLIHDYRHDEKYEQTYAVDILDKVVIQDNRNGKVEYGKDIFGNQTYSEKSNGIEKSMKRNFQGGLDYNENNKTATLQKDLYNRWKYVDSSGNEFVFGDRTWNSLKGKFKTEEDIFFSLIKTFFND